MFESPIRPTPRKVEVLLDGRAVVLPRGRSSLNAIRTFLEALALQQERVLCAFLVDGQSATPDQLREKAPFSRIEGVSVGLKDMPLRMLSSAFKETVQARTATEAAVTLVLINEASVARELWWDLASTLKEPLLTLSLLPENLYQAPTGCASLLQMRKWQLQQLATIIQEVDDACWSTRPDALSNALESRVLPWLARLQQLICLWQQTMLAGMRPDSHWDRDIQQSQIAGV